jgi:hypothetical protein
MDYPTDYLGNMGLFDVYRVSILLLRAAVGYFCSGGYMNFTN